MSDRSGAWLRAHRSGYPFWRRRWQARWGAPASVGSTKELRVQRATGFSDRRGVEQARRIGDAEAGGLPRPTGCCDGSGMHGRMIIRGLPIWASSADRAREGAGEYRSKLAAGNILIGA